MKANTGVPVRLYTRLFKIIVIHNTLEIAVYVFFFLFNKTTLQVFVTYLKVLYIYTLCDSTNINTIIEFVLHVSGESSNGDFDSYLQFRDTCGKRRNLNLILGVTP